MGKEGSEGPETSRLGRRLRAVQDSARRMVAHPGYEREAAFLVLKSAFAATLAWFLAESVLQAPSSTFAPFSAVLMVHATVARSLDHATRFGLAMVVGVILAGAFTSLLGAGIFTFAVIVLFALLVGEWPKLGHQGVQVSVAAMFAYYSFIEAQSGLSSWFHLLSIAGLVVMGCAIGVAVNLIFFPPLRYRGAEHIAHTLTQSVRDVLHDIGGGLREGPPGSDQAESWWNRAQGLPPMAQQARDRIDDATESMRFNPRRWFMRHQPAFRGYGTTVNTLRRGSEQIESITRSLVDTAGYSDIEYFHSVVLVHYANVLDAAGSCADVLGGIQDHEDLDRLAELDECVERGERACQQVADQAYHHELTQPSPWPTYEALYADARRLMEEFKYAHSELDRLRSTARK